MITIEYLSILGVIMITSVIQSLFGMGILVFGTPTLILMGYDFITTISYLLPASFSISLFQVQSMKRKQFPISNHLYLLSLPGILMGLWLVGLVTVGAYSKLLIGITLLISAVVRLWKPAADSFAKFLKKHFPTYHLIMGLTHGLTNLGGAFLAILASSVSTDKEIIRNTIAHYYLAFSAIQMIFLVLVAGKIDMLILSAPMAAASTAVYFFIGSKLFRRASDSLYNKILTLFIVAYGVVVLFAFYWKP